MWEKIKKWFGFADLNRDGKVTAEDIEFAKAVAEQSIKDTNEKINKRVARVKEEVADVVEAVKDVAEQADDVLDAVKGKARKGRKKKQ
jgi:NTP pyrophosphatase (non-canonical NTP hydrolase)